MQRRFPLRLKVAAFALALAAAAIAAVSLFTVILPFRSKLAAQEKLARQLAGAAMSLAITDGAHVDPERIHALVANSSRTGAEIAFALFWNDKDQLEPEASSVNAEALRRINEPLVTLYFRDRERALQLLASKQPLQGLRRLSMRVVQQGQRGAIGRIDLGLSTVAADAELRRSLKRDGVVLVGALLLGLVGSLALAGRIVGPLNDLSAAMQRVREGDFDVALPPRARTNDEVGDLARTFDEMAVGLRERERLRGTLGRYVSGDVAERILRETDDLALQGELRRVTVLFLDVRGFTSLSESLPPHEVVSLLNAYFDLVVERVAAHGGTLNKFIGDAAMCIWGAPREVPTPERSAVLCALDVQQAAARLSEERRARGLATAGFGIGINVGEAVAGNLGGARRLEYTVIGDAVNLAQRLESQARGGEVLVSEAIFEKVRDLVQAHAREPVRLKGKAQPVPLWEVRGRNAAEAA